MAQTQLATAGRQSCTIDNQSRVVEHPVQRWFHFKEAFAPIVADVSAGWHRKVRTCCDPFGAGTTALTCEFLGVRPTTVEVNPFLADVIEAKLASYDPDALVDARTRLARRFTRRASSESASEHSPLDWAPPTFVEPGIKGRWIFDRAIGARVQLWLDERPEKSDPALQRLFRVLLGGALVGVSNVVINGKGRRYRALSWHAPSAMGRC